VSWIGHLEGKNVNDAIIAHIKSSSKDEGKKEAKDERTRRRTSIKSKEKTIVERGRKQFQWVRATKRCKSTILRLGAIFRVFFLRVFRPLFSHFSFQHHFSSCFDCLPKGY